RRNICFLATPPGRTGLNERRTSVSHCTHRLSQQITRIAAEQLYSPDSRKLNSGRVGNSLENRIRFSLILERPHRNVRPPAPARRQRDLPRPRQHRWRALRSCRERPFCCLRFGLDARTRGTPTQHPGHPRLGSPLTIRDTYERTIVDVI